MEFVVILVFLTIILLCVIILPFAVPWKYLEETESVKKKKLLQKIKKQKNHRDGLVVVIVAASRRRTRPAYELASKILLTLTANFSKKIKTTHFGDGTRFQVGKDIVYVCCGEILDKLNYQIDKIYFDSNFTPQVQRMMLKPRLFKKTYTMMDWDIFFEDEKNSDMDEEERIQLWLEEHKKRSVF